MGAWRRGIKTKLEKSQRSSAGVDELADFLRNNSMLFDEEKWLLWNNGDRHLKRAKRICESTQK